MGTEADPGCADLDCTLSISEKTSDTHKIAETSTIMATWYGGYGYYEVPPYDYDNSGSGYCPAIKRCVCASIADGPQLSIRQGDGDGSIGERRNSRDYGHTLLTEFCIAFRNLTGKSECTF